jgi:hypothetical protein
MSIAFALSPASDFSMAGRGVCYSSTKEERPMSVAEQIQKDIEEQGRSAAECLAYGEIGIYLETGGKEAPAG